MKKYLFIAIGFLFLFPTLKVNAQYAMEHFIAPSPWQYTTKANEIVVSTQETGTISVLVRKSDGSLVTTLSVTSTAPATYRFTGETMGSPRNLKNTVYDNRGLFINASSKVSVSIRNIASDNAGNGMDDAGEYIKGNSAMLSYGNEGKGTAFRLGYYRNDYTGISTLAPIYSVMATENGTSVSLNNVVLTNLNKGQSYLFTAPMGSLLSSTKPVVANVGAYSDAPSSCADGLVTQIIPNPNLGKKYIVVRGSGNAGTQSNYPEQSTVIASEAGTIVQITNNDANGTILGTTTHTLANAGDFVTFHHGDAANAYSTSHIVSNKPVIVYAGTAGGCEIDMSTVLPYGTCTGAESFVLSKFADISGNYLAAFGYVITAHPSEPVLVNGQNLETVTASFRTAIGNSGFYLIKFNLNDLDNPNNCFFTSNAKITAGIIQHNGGFTMTGFFSVFNETPIAPQLVATGECVTLMTAPSGLAPYQWYLNGVAINGAVEQQYNATVSGTYTFTATRDCGITYPSLPMNVASCSDLAITKEISNSSNGTITFLLTATNIGPHTGTGVKVTDLLPMGYTYVSHTASTGTYIGTTGVWTIGNLAVNAQETLSIQALVNTTGNHTNTATIQGSNTDSNMGNNSDSVTPEGSLQMTKTAEEEVYHNIGDTIVYELILTNTGNISLFNINVSDDNADAGSVQPSSITSLDAGESITITATHTITEADILQGFVSNQASVIGESFNEIFVKTISDDPKTTAVKDPTITPIVYESDIVTTKTNDQDIYKKGTSVVYTITVSNNGPSDAQNVVISDPLPDGITVMEWEASNQTSGTVLNDTLTILESGETVVYTVTILVPEDYTGDLINTVFVTSDTPDPNPSCDACTDIDAPCIASDCYPALQIPKGISPNGDGDNDTFDLSDFPQISKLEIFNRYGLLVYECKNYTDQWYGQANNGNELPTGTYFYVISFNDATTKTGWVYSNK